LREIDALLRLDDGAEAFNLAAGLDRVVSGSGRARLGNTSGEAISSPQEAPEGRPPNGLG
jgi:hypothetical protein